MADQQGPKRSRSYAAVRDWSTVEKFTLLQGLKRFGSRDIDNITKMFPSRTTDQIKNAIEFYKEIALTVPPELPVRKSKTPARKNYEPVPLCSWAKYLHNTFDFKELQTGTADALRLIADYENIPPAKYTSGIDFRKIYHVLADAMEGVPLPDDPIIHSVLQKCMLDMAIYSKRFNENFFESINLSGSPEQQLQPTDSREMICFKQLISERAFNPLNIPVEFLMPVRKSSFEISSESSDESGGSEDTD